MRGVQLLAFKFLDLHNARGFFMLTVVLNYSVSALIPDPAEGEHLLRKISPDSASKVPFQQGTKQNMNCSLNIGIQFICVYGNH